MAPVLGFLLDLLADDGAATQRPRQQLDAEREAGPLVPAERRDGSAVEHRARVRRHLPARVVGDALRERRARGLGREHAEERHRRRRHVERERCLALARHGDGQRVRAEYGRRAGRRRHKLGRIRQSETDQAALRLALRVERELAGTRRRVVGATTATLFSSALSAARSEAVTAASMPGAWLALIAAEVAVSRSTTGLPAPGAGAMSSGLNIFTRPWLLPHNSAAVMISAWTSAASSSHPIMRSACAWSTAPRARRQ